LAIAASSNSMLVLDNMSGLKDGTSDALCRLATGGGFSTRTLYTTEDETVWEQTRSVVLNGIDGFANRQDLIDRAIVLRLPSLTGHKRVAEATLWESFERDRPKILGALLDGVVHALAHLQDTPTPDLRMADFARWAAAGVPAFGATGEQFVAAYSENRAAALKSSLEASLLAKLIIRLVGQSPKGIEGEPSTIHELLAIHTAREDEKRSRDFPSNAQVMSKRLTHLAPALREVGIHVVTTHKGTGKTKKRWLQLTPLGTDGTQGTDPEVASAS
jgi:hypothetical protein